VQGIASGNGAAVPVTGRLRGTALTLASADGAIRLDGRVDGDRIAPADGAWQAVRVG